MNEDQQLIEDLILGGMIGAALGAIITQSKKGVGIGGIAGVVAIATYRANQRAKQTGIPFQFVRNNAVYEYDGKGGEVFLRFLPEPKKIQKFIELR